MSRSPAVDLLAELHALGVELVAEGERLRFRPREAVGPELRARMVRLKPELIALITLPTVPAAAVHGPAADEADLSPVQPELGIDSFTAKVMKTFDGELLPDVPHGTSAEDLWSHALPVAVSSGENAESSVAAGVQFEPKRARRERLDPGLFDQEIPLPHNQVELQDRGQR